MPEEKSEINNPNDDNHDPITKNDDIDVILGIINPVGRFGNCSSLLPLFQEKDIGFLSMKAVRNLINSDVTAKDLISYALDHDGILM